MRQLNHIAIIGAGIAGLSLAIFARKRGIRVSIFERNKALSTIGAGVTLWPNATFVLQKLGILPQVEVVAGQPSGLRQQNHLSGLQSEFTLDEINTLCGFPSLTILRRDLINLLAEQAISLGSKMYFEHDITAEQIKALQQDHDLVVGCDGRMTSVVRQVIFNQSVTPKYQGFINIIGISELPDKQSDKVIEDYRGQQERFGIVPVTSNTFYWAAAWATEQDNMRSRVSWFDEMYQRFQQWPEKVQLMLKYHVPDSLNRIFVHDLDPLPYWHQDNLLIIGDAAHAPLPTSGQGACQALEDAWHLIRSLDSQELLDVKLNHFYQQRIDKVSSAQMIGRAIAAQIFSPNKQSYSFTEFSAQKLSEIWMQGLN